MTTTEPTFRPGRLWGRLDRSPEHSGCWVWTGATRSGYGAIHVGDTVEGTHRLAWVLTNGPIPDGQHVLHRCDNPACCNPAHLFLGTNADNIADRVAKGRPGGGGPLGERCGKARLTDRAVADIRRLYGAGGHSMQALADKFGVSRSAVRHVIARRTWRHVP